MKTFTAAALLLLAGLPGPARALELNSPNGLLGLQVEVAGPQKPQGLPTFQIALGGQKLLTGDLSLSASGTNLLQGALLLTNWSTTADSTYPMAFAKSNPVRDHYQQLTLQFQSPGGPLAQVGVLFRLYDDGVAYRYVLPQQPGADSVELSEEAGSIQLEGDPQLWPLYLKNFTTSHEGNYPCQRLSTLATNRLVDVPLLAEFDSGVSVAITQASLRNYAGLYLKAEGSSRRLRCVLPPLPGQGEVKVRSRLPLASPWRVFLIGSQPGRLIESSLLLNLNEPNAIGDTSWLKAGKSTFYWWNGLQAPFPVAKGVEWEKRYIDFAARNGLAFHAVIGTEGDHPWHYQSAAGYSPPGADADVSRPREGFPMEELCAYGRAKGVGIRLWVHSKPLSERLEEAFSQYEKWGIAGLMVDFLDRNDQEMVNFSERVLQSAARHHLHIQFHGVWAPTGLNRTYPNLFNHEGVLNLEYLKWSERCTPEHNVTVPFTRMLAGPMDYHLGGFRSVSRQEFKPRDVLPCVMGTRAHHLAMYVVYENPLPMLADSPAAYEGQAGFEFLRRVPTVWDETRVLSGQVGHFIVLARRSGLEWYLGAMNDWSPRQVEVPLSFLESKSYRACCWADGPSAQKPTEVIKSAQKVRPGSVLKLQLASGGGQVVWLKPLR